MRKLILEQGGLTYTGLFARPVFSLWKRGRTELVEGLFELFSEYRVDLSDIRFNSDQETLDDESVIVSVENLGEYTFSLTGVACEAETLPIENSSVFFELLQKVDDWLRANAGELQYNKHFLEYGGHGRLEPGTAQDFLQRHSTKSLKSVPQNLANGLIFNWMEPTVGGLGHVELDHSFELAEGLFLRWLVILEKDRIAYVDVGPRALRVMTNVLAEIGLALEVEE